MEIIAGAGIIENDFHVRKDLSPNICALYVDERYRCRGIAGELLTRACCDMSDEGIDKIYLVTDHTSFYERYGWEFIGMVERVCGRRLFGKRRRRKRRETRAGNHQDVCAHFGLMAKRKSHIGEMSDVRFFWPFRPKNAVESRVKQEF